MKKLIYVFVLAMLISGCATTKKYETQMQNFVGDDEKYLIAAWGNPQNVRQLENGRKVFEYSEEENIESGGNSYIAPDPYYRQGATDNTMYAGGSGVSDVVQTDPIEKTRLWCKTSFVIGSDGKVESWRFEGNNCVSNYSPPKVKK
jgi:hypothetical protein